MRSMGTTMGQGKPYVRQFFVLFFELVVTHLVFRAFNDNVFPYAVCPPKAYQSSWNSYDKSTMMTKPRSAPTFPAAAIGPGWEVPGYGLRKAQWTEPQPW